MLDVCFLLEMCNKIGEIFFKILTDPTYNQQLFHDHSLYSLSSHNDKELNTVLLQEEKSCPGTKY